MKLYSYVLTHDYGFAPNPFGGILTLATCKPKIRRVAKINDWIMGTGSVVSIGRYKLLYIAKISEILSIEEYGISEKYKFKIPIIKSIDNRQDKGDNIYFQNSENKWESRESKHHSADKAMEIDLSGKNVLICKDYWYFGNKAPSIPQEFMELVKIGSNHKCNHDMKKVESFLLWIEQFPKGINGHQSSK